MLEIGTWVSAVSSVTTRWLGFYLIIILKKNIKAKCHGWDFHGSNLDLKLNDFSSGFELNFFVTLEHWIITRLYDNNEFNLLSRLVDSMCNDSENAFENDNNNETGWLILLFGDKLDVPDPPGRPLIMGFTSRSVNLSWAPSLSSHGSQVTHYIIYTRYLWFGSMVPSWLEAEARRWAIRLETKSSRILPLNYLTKYDLT